MTSFELCEFCDRINPQGNWIDGFGAFCASLRLHLKEASHALQVHKEAQRANLLFARPFYLIS